MKNEIIEQLKKISPEEADIISGKKEIDKERYMSGKKDEVDAKKLLEAGKLIQIRTHTRFVHFPAHTHNYIEVVYMCSGSTHHVVNGKDVVLQAGEMLFLNQKATQEIYPAGENDIAVNFIMLPEFFDYGLKMIETEKNMLRDFIVDCLREGKGTSDYMHFKVAEVLPVQNLIENLIWTILNKQPNKRSINQVTMGLLFLQLMNHMDKLETSGNDEQQRFVIDVLSFIEENYKEGELTELAELLHYDIYWLSKEIKKRTGRTYTELVQTKKLNQAAYLLKNTSLNVMEIGMAVGYENMSYFHKLFQKHFGMTPRKYRISETF